MLEPILMQMKSDLAAHNRTREELLPLYVQKRLDASLKSYYEEIQKSLTTLLSKDSITSMKRVLKNL